MKIKNAARITSPNTHEIIPEATIPRFNVNHATMYVRNETTATVRA